MKGKLKKVFSLLLSFVMAVALFPYMVLAEQTDNFATMKTENVIYLSQNGEGDGSSPDSPAAFDASFIAKQTTAVLALTEDIVLEEPISINAGQDIIIRDNGSPVTISVKKNFNKSMFHVEEGGRLTVCTSTSGDNDLLILDASNADKSSSTSDPGVFVWVKGTLFLKGGTLKNASIGRGFSGAIGVTGKNAAFYMSDGKITGTFLDNQYNGAVYITGGAYFEMNGGTICNTTSNPGQVNNAAVYVNPISDGNNISAGNSSFVMTGGEIANNSAYSGGVWVGTHSPNYENEATFTMEGGKISGNTAAFGGGGVGVFSAANFYMKGGEISKNTAPIGGGVAAYDMFKVAAEGAGFDINEWGTKYHCPARFEMTGGSIVNNHAVNGEGGDEGCGGGVYIASNTSSIQSGIISGNTADRQGGGSYVGSTPYTLKIYDAIITENTASILGGGLWLCPTGDATNTVTNGGAIYRNTAEGKDAAGDDFVAVPQNDKEHMVNLADRMLGGGEVAWYKDGGVKSTEPEKGNVLGIPDGSPRYDRQNPGERQTEIRDYVGGIALKAEVNDVAAELAKSQAKVFITDNTSMRGGGIGSNGAVLIGTPQDEWTLRVSKAWDGVKEQDKKAVSIRLKIGEYVLDAITLDKSNNWTASFTQLPNPDTLGELSITVVEDETEYVVSYSEVTRDDNTKTMFIIVTNKEKPLEPDEPSEPEKPKDDSPDNPQTGDNNNLVLWFTLIGIGTAGLSVSFHLQKRRRSANK